MQQYPHLPSAGLSSSAKPGHAIALRETAEEGKREPGGSRALCSLGVWCESSSSCHGPVQGVGRLESAMAQLIPCIAARNCKGSCIFVDKKALKKLRGSGQTICKATTERSHRRTLLPPASLAAQGNPRLCLMCKGWCLGSFRWQLKAKAAQAEAGFSPRASTCPGSKAGAASKGHLLPRTLAIAHR